MEGRRKRTKTPRAERPLHSTLHRWEIFLNWTTFNRQNTRLLTVMLWKCWRRRQEENNSSQKLLCSFSDGLASSLFNNTNTIGFCWKRSKINTDNYVDDILKNDLLPWAQEHFENSTWTFQPPISSEVQKYSGVMRYESTNFVTVLNGRQTRQIWISRASSFIEKKPAPKGTLAFKV